LFIIVDRKTVGLSVLFNIIYIKLVFLHEALDIINVIKHGETLEPQSEKLY